MGAVGIPTGGRTIELAEIAMLIQPDTLPVRANPIATVFVAIGGTGHRVLPLVANIITTVMGAVSGAEVFGSFSAGLAMRAEAVTASSGAVRGTIEGCFALVALEVAAPRNAIFGTPRFGAICVLWRYAVSVAAETGLLLDTDAASTDETMGAVVVVVAHFVARLVDRAALEVARTEVLPRQTTALIDEGAYSVGVVRCGHTDRAFQQAVGVSNALFTAMIVDTDERTLALVRVPTCKSQGERHVAAEAAGQEHRSAQHCEAAILQTPLERYGPRPIAPAAHGPLCAV